MTSTWLLWQTACAKCIPHAISGILMSDSSRGASLWILVLLHGWLRWLQGKIAVWVLCRSGPADCFVFFKHVCGTHGSSLHTQTPLYFWVWIAWTQKFGLIRTVHHENICLSSIRPVSHGVDYVRFNLSVVKQFNAPTQSVTLDYCASHCKEQSFCLCQWDIVLFFGFFFWDTSLLCSLLSYDCPRLRKRLFRKATWTSWNSHKILVHLQLFRMSSELSKNPTAENELKLKLNVSLEFWLTLMADLHWITWSRPHF